MVTRSQMSHTWLSTISGPQIGQLVGGTPARVQMTVATFGGRFRGHSSRACRKMARQFLTQQRH